MRDGRPNIRNGCPKHANMDVQQRYVVAQDALALDIHGRSQYMRMIAHNAQYGCPKPKYVGVQRNMSGRALCVDVDAQNLVWSPRASGVEAHFVAVQESCGGLPKCVTSLGRPGGP